MKVVINKCYGGFGLSEAAYEKLIEWGIPVLKYKSENNKEVIFDRSLDDNYKESRVRGRYWELWTMENRSHPLLVKVVEDLGTAANGKYSELKVIDIPNSTEYIIEEYDGREWISEVHQTWD
jgi:hypothetical protein